MTRGQGSRIKRNAARALKNAGLQVPKNLKPGKPVKDLEPAKAEEAKHLQKKLKELTWTDSMSARQMQSEIYWTKKRLKELLAPDDDDEDKDEEEEIPIEEEEEEDSEEASSTQDGKLAKAELEAAQKELEKAKQELEKFKKKAKEQKEKRKDKKREEKKAKVEVVEKQKDEKIDETEVANEPEKADVQMEPNEPEKAVEDELPDYDAESSSWTEVEGKKKKNKKTK